MARNYGKRFKTWARDLCKKKSPYFKPEEGYDKKVYENTIWNWMYIVFCLALLYAYHFLTSLAILILGVFFSFIMMWVEIGIFIFAIAYLVAITIVGIFIVVYRKWSERLSLEIMEAKKKQQDDAKKEKRRMEAESNNTLSRKRKEEVKHELDRETLRH